MAAIALSVGVLAGYVAAAAIYRRRLRRALVAQLERWRAIADAIFGWLEQTPIPLSRLSALQDSIEQATRGHLRGSGPAAVVDRRAEEQVRATAARLLYELSRMEPPRGDRRGFEAAVEEVKASVQKLLTRVPGPS